MLLKQEIIKIFYSMEQEITHYSRGKLHVGQITVRESVERAETGKPKSIKVIYTRGRLTLVLIIIRLFRNCKFQ
jgi:hypothetical protein